MDDECDSEVWGFLKPSSLISSAGTFIALGSALLLLLVGAVIDDTDYHRQIGEYSMHGLIVLNAIGRVHAVGACVLDALREARRRLLNDLKMPSVLHALDRRDVQVLCNGSKTLLTQKAPNW